MDFVDDDRADIQIRIDGSRSCRGKGALCGGSVGQVDNAARKFAGGQEQARFIAFGCTIQVVGTANRANDQFFAEIGGSVQNQVAAGRNDPGFDGQGFVTDLGFKFPAGHVDILGSCIVEFHPCVLTGQGRHDFVDAHIGGRQPFVVTDTGVTLQDLACAPGRGKSGVSALVDEGAALAVGKGGPRRFLAVGAADVTVSGQLDIDNIAFVRKFCNRTGRGIVIPGAKETARKGRIRFLEQFNVVRDDDIFALG